MLNKKDVSYIEFDEFVNNSGFKETTIKRKYKQIPGLIKNGKEFRVISGTRYPYRLRNKKIEDSSSKRYVLLKAIRTSYWTSSIWNNVERVDFSRTNSKK